MSEQSRDSSLSRFEQREGEDAATWLARLKKVEKAALNGWDRVQFDLALGAARQ